MISSVKIGAFTYKVSAVLELKDNDDNKVDGHLWHSGSQIMVDAELEAQPMKQTLLHEIVHEIAIQAGQDEMTEGMVDAVAFGWYQVMRDNPELIEMITKG